MADLAKTTIVKRSLFPLAVIYIFRYTEQRAHLCTLQNTNMDIQQDPQTPPEMCMTANNILESVQKEEFEWRGFAK